MISRLLCLAVLIPSIVIGQVCDEGLGDICSPAERTSAPKVDISYAKKIAGLIKRNTRGVATDAVAGNPMIEYEIELLPDGNVKDIKVIRGSGYAAFDEAVQRAVYSTAPFERDPATGRVPASILVRQRLKHVVEKSATYQAGNKKPEYPKMALSMGESGKVVLRVLVTSDGDAGSVEVMESSGFPNLDKAAVDAVRQWKFNPAMSDNKAIDSFYEIPITFKPPADDSPIISPGKSTVCKTITDAPPAELTAVMPDQGLYVASNVQFLDLPAKGLLDGMAALIYIKKRGRKFIQLDNLRGEDGKDSSRQLLKLADCVSKEFLIQDQVSFSCPWATGKKEKSPTTNHIIVNRWLKPEKGSHENRILEFVCSK